MIKNKLITITKENQFDMGWTIFTPYQLSFYKNPRYKPLLVADIVRSITRSDKVCIALSEECLASAIVKELEWVNKYITIELIAKTEQIAQRYTSIKFSSVKIDPDITFNYLSIKGPIPLSVMIDNGYTETTTLLKEIYFEKNRATNDYSFLNDLEEIVLLAIVSTMNMLNSIMGVCKKGKRRIELSTKNVIVKRFSIGLTELKRCCYCLTLQKTVLLDLLEAERYEKYSKQRTVYFWRHLLRKSLKI